MQNNDLSNAELHLWEIVQNNPQSLPMFQQPQLLEQCKKWATVATLPIGNL